MAYDSIIWDLDGDSDGNVQYCAQHGISKDEVEEAFDNVIDEDFSRSSGRPMIFGETNAGRHVVVIYEEIDPDTVYPVTAYDAPRRRKP